MPVCSTFWASTIQTRKNILIIAMPAYSHTALRALVINCTIAHSTGRTRAVAAIASIAYHWHKILLVQSLSYVNGASYGATYHGVVTDAEEAHHLYVSRY